MKLFLFALLTVCLAVSIQAAGPDKVSRKTIDEAVEKAIAVSSHPRLFADAEGFARVKLAAQDTNGLVRAGAERVRRSAEALLSLPPDARIKTGRRLLGVSRDVLFRVSTLAMAYRLYGDKRFLDRAVKELLAVAAFEDWNPSHFLDVAEMTLGVSIGYDWLYNDLDAKSRETIAGAIRQKGLLAYQQNKGWFKAHNNWGQVCHAGMLAGALALMESDRGLAEETIHRSVTHLPISMAALAPDGCYPEGPGYWSYGVDFNVMAIAMLESVFRTDYGLGNLPGFQAAADYINLVTGPSGCTFNYADGGMGRGTDIALWWYAKRFHRPYLLDSFEKDAFLAYSSEQNKAKLARGGERLFALSLFWIAPEGKAGAETENGLPLTRVLDGPVPIALQRSSWNDPDAFFIGLKGGSPSGPHGHQDGGSFVLDAGNVRWVADLGGENYNKIEQLGMDLWHMQQDSDRWKIFRLGSLSHNVPVIDGERQWVKGRAKIISCKTNDASEITLDLSSLYTNAASVIRTGVLFAEKKTYQLTDTLRGLHPGAQVRWAMMTPAKVASQCANEIVLSSGTRKLSVKQLRAVPAAWKVDEEPAPNSWDSPNRNFRQITFTVPAPASGEVEIQVSFTLVQ